MSSLVARLAEDFTRHYGDDQGVRFALAPGRVNLIGEHTDYNDGFVLPMAIDRHVGIAFRVRDDDQVCAYAPEYEERRCLRFGDLRPGRPEGWMSYVAGVIWALGETGQTVRGMDISIRGDVPIGAGLSSSAALEMAVARAACEASDIPWDAAGMARLGQKAEREYVGVSCGIMDQFASAMTAEGKALLLDCRTLETRLVGLPEESGVVVMDTGVRRSLTDSAYNERYAQCQEAVEAIRRHEPDVRALRDVTPEMLTRYEDAMDPVTFRRASHVVAETLRPEAFARALEAGDLEAAGSLMDDSHRSLRDLYGVSSPELDFMVEAAWRQEGCDGARLTGAGFGGCAVALVRRTAVDTFIEAVLSEYRSKFDHAVDLFPVEASAGAHVVQAQEATG